MDDDDNQDEPINRSLSQSKGKRPAQWVISDSDEDVEEESEEGESEEENPVDGEEEEEDEDEDEEEEEDDDEEDDDEEDAKPEDGAVEGTSADLAAMSSDEDSETCPICLNSFNSQPVATPESCEHYFCLDCILEWAKNANSCPVDRMSFDSIYLRKCFGGKVMKMITVQKPAKENQEEIIDVDLEQTNCEVCGGSDREDRLLLCDGCDAGYHMECLTPPLDSVPVEEWFCPECEPSNRHPAEEVSDAESLPSTARPATSRHHHHLSPRRRQPWASGPTRAIARTQQSERVRASVNRHRITQARSSQLAPTYLIQSTWLDETINAVVAGLNTAVYVRDLTPRARSSGARKTGRRRKVKRRKTTSAKGKTGKSASTGVKRRKRRVRRTKSRKKHVVKKPAGSRSRIASNLGMAKDKNGSSLPTVYRPSEHTLSSMRADIGAASLSIYGDPFDLDPFVEREEGGHQAHVTSLLEAKRRGISRSALRSHQPVARPVTASLSRRGMDVPRSSGVVEAAPVPDLLGSILSGQSMLLMDSSDVVINRDGSLKASKPVTTAKPESSRTSGDSRVQINPGMSPAPGDGSQSPNSNRDLPGSLRGSINGHFSHSPACSPPSTHTHHSSFTDFPPSSRTGLPPLRPNRPTFGNHGPSAVRDPRDVSSSSTHTVPVKGTSQSQTQPKKAPIKPMWVDVSVLPRIPKIKRETSSDSTSHNDSRRNSSSSDSNCSNSGSSVPEIGMNSLAGDKSRHQSVDHRKDRVAGQAPRHQPGGASSSPAFSYSFSSSSSSTDSPAGQTRHSSFSSSSSAASSSSSAVSFRINSSGNSWRSRRLNIPPSTPSSASEGRTQEPSRRKIDEARKRQMHRDKQLLLASRTPVTQEQDRSSIYDPFNPTMDSSSSDSESESSRHTTQESMASSLRKKEVRNKQGTLQVKVETHENEVSQEQPIRTRALESISEEVRCSEERVKIESIFGTDDDEDEEETSLDTTIKEEPEVDDEDEEERGGPSVNVCLGLETPEPTLPAFQSRSPLKTEKEAPKEDFIESEETHKSSSPCKNKSSETGSTPTLNKRETESKPDSKSCSKSPSRDLDNKKKTSKEQRSSSSEKDRGRSGDHHNSDREGRRKEKKDKERSSRRSTSRERRRRMHSSSQSSGSDSPGRSRKKRCRSRSRSKDRKRSRSVSRSSSREHSRKKKQKQRSKEGNADRERDRKRHGRSRSRSTSRSMKIRRGRSRSESRSRSRSTSRSKKMRRGRSRSKSRSRSRSTSRSKMRRGRSLSKSRSRSRSTSRSKKTRRGQSRLESRSRSRSTSTSRKTKRGRSHSKSQSRSRSRSRERRKEPARISQKSSLSSRDKVVSESRDKSRHRSRSNSRDRRKEDDLSSKSSQNISEPRLSSSKDKTQHLDKRKEKDAIKSSAKEKNNKGRSSNCSQKNSGSQVSSAVDKTQLQEKKKEKDSSQCSVKEKNDANSNKRELPVCTSTTKVKKEEKEPSADVEAMTETKVVKEMKKHKSFDMFEDFSLAKSVKKEETDIWPLPETKRTDKEEIKENLIKTEMCEIKDETCEIPIKSQPSSPKLSPLPSFSTPMPADCDRDVAGLVTSEGKEQDPTGTSVRVKQEPLQPSDSDDDFNVDVMLDNLDYVKSERTEGGGDFVKRGKEMEKGSNEGEQERTGAGAATKSKTHVKRVTWNIQEPEASPPEKSASKVALYKLKRRQEGFRRPPSTTQTSSQEIAGTGSDSSKQDAVIPRTASHGSDDRPAEGLPVTGQGDVEDKDKDKYLKKLHMQERAVEEVKLAIKPFYQKRDINKDEYKEILRKAVQKVCHSKSGEINPVKVGNLVKAYVDKYKHARKHKKGEDASDSHTEPMKNSDSP